MDRKKGSFAMMVLSPEGNSTILTRLGAWKTITTIIPVNNDKIAIFNVEIDSLEMKSTNIKTE